MTLAALSVLSPSGMNTRGVVILKDEHATRQEIETLASHNVESYEASHPIPSLKNTAASAALLALAESCTYKSLALCLVSGGGSALFSSPIHPVTLEDLSRLNAILLGRGLPIQDMNAIRKRLERGKGGGLARAIYPGTTAGLVLSDVIGDDLGIIASGPTVRGDDEEGTHAWNVAREWNLEESLPATILQVLKQPGRDTDNAVFEESRPASSDNLCQTYLVGNNQMAVNAAASRAEELGYTPVVLSTELEGDTKQVAQFLIGLAKELRNNNKYSMVNLPCALIAGGETTVRLSNIIGKGGRNQDLALAAAILMREHNLRDVLIASVGTDGTDGPTDAAGALVDGKTVDRIERGNDGRTGKEALKGHDAYTFLTQEVVEGEDTPALVKTGPTGTNVADIYFVLIR